MSSPLQHQPSPLSSHGGGSRAPNDADIDLFQSGVLKWSRNEGDTWRVKSRSAINQDWLYLRLPWTIKKKKYLDLQIRLRKKVKTAQHQINNANSAFILINQGCQSGSIGQGG